MHNIKCLKITVQCKIPMTRHAFDAQTNWRFILVSKDVGAKVFRWSISILFHSHNPIKIINTTVWYHYAIWRCAIDFATCSFHINRPFKYIVAMKVEILTDHLYLLSTCWIRTVDSKYKRQDLNFHNNNLNY